MVAELERIEGRWEADGRIEEQQRSDDSAPRTGGSSTLPA
jgi:hypothetical protein